MLEARDHLIRLASLGYRDFLYLKSRAKIVLADSCGIQEKTTILGVPRITLRVNTERLIAIEEFGLKEPRTKRMAEILKSLEVNGKALLIDDNPDRAVVLSTRNLPGVHCIAADSPNIYDLITHDYVVATKAALKRMEKAYA